MDIRILRYFIAIAEEGSISRAAERLHVAQPALSAQIRNLEGELGSQLLHRIPRGVVLTEAGTKLLGHARQIVRALTLARDDLLGDAAATIGSVTVSFPQSVAMVLTRPLVEEVLRSLPRVSLSVRESNTGYIPELLRTGRIDAGFVFREADTVGLKARRLLDEELLVIGPPGAFENGAGGIAPKPLRFSRLAQLPLVIPGRPHSLRELLNDYARRARIELRTLVEVDAIPQIKELVAAGVGHAVLSSNSVREDLAAGRIAAARIVSPALRRSVFLCGQAEVPQTRAVRAVEETILRVAAGLVDTGSWDARLGSAID
ncbi:LysR family transcriptional regulator [Roseococcus sp.]|uniref:LysR family transcriptional regulator n=1 Tax=Roseococcus sp. TaxID=2109646 RepID=UPI003BAC4CB1